MASHRSELHKEVVEALISSKAVDFAAVGEVFSKYGARAALHGESLWVQINWRVWDICIPPEPYINQVNELGKIQER